MSRISTKSYRLENWGESGQTKTAWRSEESNKRAYLDGRAASYSHRARCGRKHCVQRTDVQLQLGEEEGSLGSFSMSFENAQEQWWVGGRIFLTLRWQYTYLFRIDSGIYKQEKPLCAGVFWCTWANMGQRESGPGAAVYGHAHASAVATRTLNTLLKAPNYPELWRSLSLPVASCLQKWKICFRILWSKSFKTIW